LNELNYESRVKNHEARIREYEVESRVKNYASGIIDKSWMRKNLEKSDNNAPYIICNRTSQFS